MIPILYTKNESTFTHNGIGFLKDATKCTVTEERNGSYECSLQYPITGKWYDQITDGCIIKAKANETGALQLFRIYKTSKPLKGIVTYSAEHISYDLGGLPVTGLTISNGTAQAAITRALQETPFTHNFTAISDIETLNSTNITAPCSVRSVLGGQAGSVLDVWGGEYEFDNFVVKLHAHRGANNGVKIQYGKNLIDINQENNISECYTHILPYALKDENGTKVYVYLTEKVIPLSVAENIGHSKAYIMNFSDRFTNGEEITEAKLRQKATAYAQAAELGVPKVNITVSFVQLWQTEEYKNIAPLERVKLCDTVTVEFEKLKMSASAKVIKTEYDSINEKYLSIELGDAKSTLADTIKTQNTAVATAIKAIKDVQDKATAEIQAAIATATAAITGQSGGYVVLNPPNNPQEILILDSPKLDTALKVWRWNSGGLGYSSNGYLGPYTTAITQDGKIIADFIGGGTISGQSISGGTITGTTITGGTITGTTINGGSLKQTVGSGEFGTFLEIAQASINGGYNSYSDSTIDMSISINPSKQISYNHLNTSGRHFGIMIDTGQKRNGEYTSDGAALLLSTDQIWTREPGGTGLYKNYTGQITVSTPSGNRTLDIWNGLIIDKY